MLVKLDWLGYTVWWKNYDDMLSRFHLIPERNRRTDGQTDRRTDLLYQYRASVLWRAIKTTEHLVKLVWIQVSGYGRRDNIRWRCVVKQWLIHSLCDLLTFANINNGANLQLPWDTQKQKAIQLQETSPPPLIPHRGLRPQTPVIGSRSALAMKFEPCGSAVCSSKLILKKALLRIMDALPKTYIHSFIFV